MSSHSTKPTRSWDNPGREDREYLLSQNQALVQQAWLQARRDGPPDPVVILMDPENEVARALTAAMGMTASSVARHRAECKARGMIPTIVGVAPRGAAVLICATTVKNSQMAGMLSLGGVPGFIDTLVIANGGNSLGRIPEPLVWNVRGGTDSLDRVARVGRNDPCPCGSGKKYKRCCGSRAAIGSEPGPKPFVCANAEEFLKALGRGAIDPSALTEVKEGTLMNLVIDREYLKLGGREIGRQIADYPDTLNGRVFLVFVGWDDDPRELWQVPEVVTFCRDLLSYCPDRVFPKLLDESKQPDPREVKGLGGLRQLIGIAFPELMVRLGTGWVMNLAATEARLDQFRAEWASGRVA